MPSDTTHEEIEIRNCSCCRPIDRNEAKYHTDIIATGCAWKENPGSNKLLELTPVAGQTYSVMLHQPVKFSLNMRLWLLYNCPTACYNGYEKEEDIEQAKFCFGQITKIVSYDKLGATVKFNVLKTLTIQEVLDKNEIRELPEFWTDFFIKSIKDDDYSLQVIGKYFELSASMAQGDIGQSCVFSGHENTYVICLLNQWMINETATFGGKYRLPDSIRKAIIPEK